MKLRVLKRASMKKSEIKKIRREGDIPAVIYVKGKSTDAVAIKGDEFTTALRTMQPGRLSTTVFTLVDDSGKERRVIVKEVQYHPTTYNILHLDFEELFSDVKVKVKVPIELTGAVDCIGVKLGGNLRQVIRHLRISCLPKDIPDALQVDVKNMAMFDSKKLSDIEIPQTVRPLVDLNEVAVIVAKR
jgi:large subunit ribosomal protein L25